MRKALIFTTKDDNRIYQIEKEPFPVAYPLVWIDCPDEVTTEYTYENGQFVAPKSIVNELSILDFRFERNRLLTQSDWTQLPDTNPPGGKEVWVTYRQELRDLPETYIDLNSVVWPTPPN